MKQKDQKEKTKDELWRTVKTLKILNCEEIEVKQIEPEARKLEIIPKIIDSSIDFKTEKPVAPSDTTPKDQKRELTAKEKQKKQSESVICIIEEEWQAELKRLKEYDMYLTNYKRVPKSVADKNPKTFGKLNIKL